MKPTVTFVGEDGNIFNLLGIARRALRDAGQIEKVKEMSDRVMSSDSYNAALIVMMEYVEVR